MKKILIIGAGSIGNHFNNAERLGYNTSVTDISAKSLKLMKTKIFQKDTKMGSKYKTCVTFRFER